MIPTPRALELLPAVDVQDGRAVRLVQGEAGSATSYGDPLTAALDWQRAGGRELVGTELTLSVPFGERAVLSGRVDRLERDDAGRAVVPGRETLDPPIESLRVDVDAAGHRAILTNRR